MSEERCSECGVSAADCSLEYGMCPLCANSEWDSETFTLRPRIDKDAEITALRAALDQERRRLAWIADNTGRDVWLDQFERRFSKGDGADGADDLRAKIDALLSGREEGGR